MAVVRRIVSAFVVLGVAMGIGVAVYRNMEWLPPEIDHVPSASFPSPHVNVDAPGQTSAQLMGWADSLAPQLKMSPRALAAYGNAEQIMLQSDPSCHVDWTTVAALAYVESRHGTYGGAVVDSYGNTGVKIRGRQLDGTNHTQHIPDTDGGKLDGDDVYDVAMGPFQFIPETWLRFGMDANGDGVADPDNIDDAAASAARYLCAGGRDLLSPAEWVQAILSYNNSMNYVREVFAVASAYAEGRSPRWSVGWLRGGMDANKSHVEE